VRALPDLMVSGLSLTKIARRHGFSSRQAMTRLFATSAGLAPREFRAAGGRRNGVPPASVHPL